MKNCSACLVLSVALLIGAKEAAAVRSVTDTSPVTKLETGTCLVVELSKSLNAKKLQPGDKVTAKVTQAVVVNGKVVIPRGAKLVGNVTETKARSKENPESRLGVVFAKALLKNGAEISLDAVVQALGPAQRSRVDLPDPMLPPQIGPDNSGGVPQPMGAGRQGATGNSRGSYNAPPTQPVSVAMAPRVSAGTIPNQKEGLQENGLLGSGSRGVFSLPGLKLKFTGAAQIPVITSVRDDIKLESGVQMVLRVAR
ncbi:MAG TPA: hypothetical protein VHA33_21300 [Candidatus Angelobacter sp.]|jgi:hypothetical protein|nr:hypothetical protein [Candidatus Angelobacter sp.]